MQDFLSKEPIKEDMKEQHKIVLQELNALKGELQGQYNRLLELLMQGNVETVQQILHHVKALNQIKSTNHPGTPS